MAEQNRLRAAVIGCGFIGQLHAHAIRRSPHASLCAICDVDYDRAVAAGAQSKAVIYASFKEMLKSENLDVVTIATPDHLHVEPVLSAISHNLHVFCEKPLASSYAEAKLMSAKAKQQGVVLGVDYNRRFGFGYRKAKEVLNEIHPSRIRQAVIQVSDGIPSTVAEQPYAILTSLVSHHLDLLRWFGGDVRTVQTAMQGTSQQHPHHVSLLLESYDGMLGSITASWRVGQKRTVEYCQITTDDRVISVQDVQDEVTVWEDSYDTLQRIRPSPFESGNRFFDTIEAHVLAFLAAVAHGTAAPVSADDGCATLRLIEAAIQSQNSGQRIEIPRE
jgi:predicted dehydrogenase